MARIIKGWLEFSGRKSNEFGVRLTDFMSHTRAEMRGTSYDVAGLDGDLWKSDGTYKPFDLKRKLRCRLSRMDEVSAWLTGFGLLRFSWAENRVYEARAAKAIDYKQISIDDDPVVEFAVTFTCQPFRRIIPEADPIVLTAAETIDNPGTVYSLPKITVVGSGDFSLSINTQTMFFVDVAGGIVLDSELVDAFTLDEKALANDHASGEFFRMQPGPNMVSWVLEDGASVESVTIEPRWRCI